MLTPILILAIAAVGSCIVVGAARLAVLTRITGELASSQSTAAPAYHGESATVRVFYGVFAVLAMEYAYWAYGGCIAV